MRKISEKQKGINRGSAASKKDNIVKITQLQNKISNCMPSNKFGLSQGPMAMYKEI